MAARVAEVEPVPYVARDDFLANHWDYRPGEHVTILGRTGSGKTYLAYQLLDQTTTPELPGVVLVTKPKDATVDTFTKRLEYRKVRSWPPVSSMWLPAKPRGWTVWPPHKFDPDVDDPRLAAEFRRTVLDCYKRGKRVLFSDEITELVALGLKRELDTVWERGRSMGCGLWASSQRPAYVPMHAYSAPEHLFLAFDPDRRNRDRFREIGGVDPDLIAAVVFELGRFEWLYIRREDRAVCVVGK